VTLFGAIPVPPLDDVPPSTGGHAHGLVTGRARFRVRPADVLGENPVIGSAPVPRHHLKDFEKKLRVRPLRKRDHAAVVALQLACFPTMKPWSKAQFESQIDHFGGGQLGLEYEGRLVASAASLIVKFDLHDDWHDWASVSDKGMIGNHDPKGDTLYGIEIMVHPEFRGMRLARRLYEARKRLCREPNLLRMVIGGRIPGYRKYAKRISAEAYVAKVQSKKLVDPVLTTQLSNGFELVRLIPDYLPSDEDSAGYATHMEWTNVDYVADARRRVAPVQLVRVARFRLCASLPRVRFNVARTCRALVAWSACGGVDMPRAKTPSVPDAEARCRAAVLSEISLVTEWSPADKANLPARLTIHLHSLV